MRRADVPRDIGRTGVDRQSGGRQGVVDGH
jgi:hypothetical protein